MKHIYPPNLETFIKEEAHIYIPRKIKLNEQLKIFKRYWSVYDSMYYKVDQIFDYDGVEYYSVKFLNSLYGVIPHPVNDTYELMIDRNDIQNVDDIINTKISYTGAEIKFWFFIKNIDLDSEKYCGFWSFLDPESNNEISDDKYYFLYASYQNGTYKDCKISTDKSKESKWKRRKE